MRPGWQGKYPGPIVDVKRDDAIPARSTPCASAPDRTCQPRPALYHPWSKSLPAGPDRFVTVRGVDRWVFQAAHTMEGKDAPVAAGTVLEVLFYAGEGYCEQRLAGGAADVGPCPELWGDGVLERQGEGADRPETQLFRAPCGDGTEAWIEGSEAILELPSVSEGELIAYGQVGPAGGGACEELVLRGKLGEAEAFGRKVVGLDTDNARYVGLIGAALGEPVELAALWRVDLEDDGSDEVLFEATGKSTGRTTLGVRAVRAGEVKTLTLAAAKRGDPAQELRGLADVDHDGTLEVLKTEGGARSAWVVTDLLPTRADDTRCGW